MDKLPPSLHKPTRIRYTYIETERLYTSGAILAGTQLLYVEIKPVEECQYTIYDFHTAKPIYQCGSNKSMAAAKRLAKLKLIELGATFDDEVRRRKPKCLE